jgi:hypothetical protein
MKRKKNCTMHDQIRRTLDEVMAAEPGGTDVATGRRHYPCRRPGARL